MKISQQWEVNISFLLLMNLMLMNYRDLLRDSDLAVRMFPMYYRESKIKVYVMTLRILRL